MFPKILNSKLHLDIKTRRRNKNIKIPNAHVCIHLSSNNDLKFDNKLKISGDSTK